MIILDTNVISEVIKPQPSQAVLSWLDAQDLETLFISSITVAELLYGIGSMPNGNRKNRLETAIGQTLAVFDDRTLPFDAPAARCHASLAIAARQVGKGFPKPDGYIAAIAVSADFAVATRDSSAFVAAGANVIDPWTFGR
jgi:toxin FitB